MKSISCIAIDDEPMALLVIEHFCKRKENLLLQTYNEPVMGLKAIEEQRPDLVFLDIEMNSISGLEIAHLLPKECCFILTTAHAHYALEGFDLDAVDFLHKPFSYERFEKAVDKAVRRLKSKVECVPDVVVVKEEYNNVTIRLEDITHIEALGNYVKIHRMNQSYVLSRLNMKAMLDLLPSDRFIRIHRSFIISQDKVKRFTKNTVTIDGTNKVLPIGKCYVEDIVKVLLETSGQLEE